MICKLCNADPCSKDSILRDRGFTIWMACKELGISFNVLKKFLHGEPVHPKHAYMIRGFLNAKDKQV
jgi:hypothetical protein